MRSLLRAGTLIAVFWCLTPSNAAASKDFKLVATGTAASLSNDRAVDEQPSSCVKICLDRVLPQYDCAVKRSCYCGNSKLATTLEKCLSATCALPDYLAGQKSYADTCDKPVRDKGPATRKLCWSMFAIATVVIAGRFIGRMRYLGGSGYSWDDCELHGT